MDHLLFHFKNVHCFKFGSSVRMLMY